MFEPGWSEPASALVQTVGHWPQWFGSVARVAHVTPPSLAVHFVVGDSHELLHAPLEHTSPVLQALVHDPQC